MRTRVRQGLFCMACFGFSACSGTGTDAEPGITNDEQAIVRAVAEGGKDQVVLLYAQVVTNGSLSSRTCTGTYFADRVVLTAAHCLEDAWGDQVFVYWGNDFATDFAALPRLGQTIEVPPPGSATRFAQADSYEQHPDWDAELVHPDLAVVYLDRKLPFAPLPIARFRIDDKWLGSLAALNGWGASKALSADISETVGGRVQRVGVTRILGSPTPADYHADDPNPGMLVPSIRRDTLKTDGRAPYSNTCAGDSGGPLLVNVGGRATIAGVAEWTGLYCEDYSLFTRIDPFLSFVDRAAYRGGRAPLETHLDCVTENADGSLTAYFGYDNANGVSLTVPYGPRNALALDSAQRRPSEFLPGRHDFVFGVDFQGNQQLTYRVDPDVGPTRVLHANRRSPRCGADVATEVACGGACRAAFNAGCSDALPSDAQCIADCVGLTSSFPQCEAEITAMNTCYANTPAGQEHWACVGDGFMPASLDCGDAEAAFLGCLGY